VVPEAELDQSEAGLVPASAGWFLMNARGAMVLSLATVALSIDKTRCL
jgi:hypothetical protein